MSDFMDLLADLSPEQQELFRLRLARLHQDSAATPAALIPRQPRTGAPFPLSFAQQRLWFLDQLMPGDLSYVIPLAVRLSGRLNRDALNRSVEALIQRHEIFRTTFAQGADLQPVQVIAPPQPEGVVVPCIDLRDWPIAERQAEAQRRATSEIRQAFNLATGPLLRPTLLRLDDDEHWLILAMHHIIADQWSLGVLIREFGTLYQAYAADPPADPLLPELPIQYADYTMWLRDQLHGEVLDQHLDYWRQQLADLAPLELPTDFPRPPVYTSSGGTYPLELPLDLSTALQELSRREGTTLFMTLLAAFDVLLHRWSGQTDIVIGSPIANRNHTATEGLIGFLINTLALRVDLRGNPMFRELLARVRRVCLDAYRHQDLPFEMVVDAVQARRDQSRNPLFQVSFVLLNAPMEPLELPDISLYPLELDRGATQFDLSLSMIETAAGLGGRLEYNTNLFDRATIARLVGHFRTLLQGIVANPDQSIAALPLLSDSERQTLLYDWNATQQPYPEDMCVHHRFEQRAALYPDTLAIASAQGKLTYGELNQQANRLAQRLQTLGAGPEVPIAICLERCADLVVALLATLKAGSTYVPLSPATPPARLSLMLQDTQAPVLITHASLWTGAANALTPDSLAGAHVLFLDQEWDRQVAEFARPADVPIWPQQSAYIIYTSGSTGVPKGVPISHASLLNLVAWHQRVYQITAQDRASLLAEVSFDASVWELWPYLVAGASIHIPAPSLHADVSGLINWIATCGITICFMPTPLAEAALETAWPAHTVLRWLLTGGDRLHRSPPPHLPGTLVNHYGPTETTVVTTALIVSPAEDWDGPPPPIGRPIDNVQVYLLDAHMTPVPIGAPGELYLGGAGLARGYLNRPALTATQFIPDPFTQTPGSRLYRTGDLARYLPDGRIDFLGRIDHQVKLRGYRIELGEIETALRQHQAVREAVVTLRGSGDRRYLAAYIVPKDGEPNGEQRTKNKEQNTHSSPSPAAAGEGGSQAERDGGEGLPSTLREFLAQRLPSYMIPTAFVVLAALPVTPNGKLDRRALPDPDAADHMDLTERTATEPRTPVEMVLALIWSQVLGLTQVDVHADFFDLRGHSLLAVQVIGRLKEIFPLDLPIQLLFEAPTIATLAERIVELGAAQQNDISRIAQLFIQLDQLSDDEVARMLAEQPDAE